jgi:shikimate dehydrogenase
MRTFGLIGYPLSHSFSRKYFTEKFLKEGITDCRYELFSIEDVNDLPVLIAQDHDLSGLNVTIPHKLGVLPLLNELDDAAANIGAVNCISVIRTIDDEQASRLHLKGYNTDAYGFEESLKPLLKVEHTMALVLGNGGAAKAVKYVLNKLEIPFVVVARKAADESILYSDVTPAMLAEYTVVINTTPLGMSPNINSFPDLPYQAMTEKHLAYDLVYNPAETLFLKKALAQGATVKNGLEMLHLQAERSWEIWNQ